MARSSNHEGENMEKKRTKQEKRRGEKEAGGK
jgi:hypothetical protein